MTPVETEDGPGSRDEGVVLLAVGLAALIGTGALVAGILANLLTFG